MIDGVVLFKPYIEQQFTDKAVDTGFIRIPARNIDSFFKFKKNVKHPGHIIVKKIPSHDKHVEHMGPGAVHNFIESRKIFRILFDKNLLRYIEALRMMGMVIMRPIALDVVFAFIRDDNGIAGQQVFPILFRKDLGFFLSILWTSFLVK